MGYWPFCLTKSNIFLTYLYVWFGEKFLVHSVIFQLIYDPLIFPVFVWSCKMYERKIENCGSHLIFSKLAGVRYAENSYCLLRKNSTKNICEVVVYDAINNICVTAFFPLSIKFSCSSSKRPVNVSNFLQYHSRRSLLCSVIDILSCDTFYYDY